MLPGWVRLFAASEEVLNEKDVPFPGLGSSQAPTFAFLYQEVWANCCLSCLEPGQGREGSQALSYGRALLSRLWSENRLSRTLG